MIVFKIQRKERVKKIFKIPQNYKSIFLLLSYNTNFQTYLKVTYLVFLETIFENVFYSASWFEFFVQARQISFLGPLYLYKEVGWCKSKDLILDLSIPVSSLKCYNGVAEER